MARREQDRQRETSDVGCSERGIDLAPPGQEQVCIIVDVSRIIRSLALADLYTQRVGIMGRQLMMGEGLKAGSSWSRAAMRVWRAKQSTGYHPLRNKPLTSPSTNQPLRNPLLPSALAEKSSAFCRTTMSSVSRSPCCRQWTMADWTQDWVGAWWSICRELWSALLPPCHACRSGRGVRRSQIIVGG